MNNTSHDTWTKSQIKDIEIIPYEKYMISPLHNGGPVEAVSVIRASGFRFASQSKLSEIML